MSINAEISLLLIEVDPTAMEICYKIIARFCPQLIVHKTGNAHKAIALFKKYKHDIVISDMNLPRKGGIQIAREACAERPDTLVLFLTGDHSHNRHIEEHAADLCLHHILIKPLDARDLVRSITEAMDKVIRCRTG